MGLDRPRGLKLNAAAGREQAETFLGKRVSKRVGERAGQRTENLCSRALPSPRPGAAPPLFACQSTPLPPPRPPPPRPRPRPRPPPPPHSPPRRRRRRQAPKPRGVAQREGPHRPRPNCRCRRRRRRQALRRPLPRLDRPRRPGAARWSSGAARREVTGRYSSFGATGTHSRQLTMSDMRILSSKVARNVPGSSCGWLFFTCGAPKQQSRKRGKGGEDKRTTEQGVCLGDLEGRKGAQRCRETPQGQKCSRGKTEGPRRRGALNTPSPFPKGWRAQTPPPRLLQLPRPFRRSPQSSSKGAKLL